MIVSREWSHFRSLRWGRSNFGAVLWWVASPIGQYIVVKEWKFQQLDPAECAREIKLRDAELGMKFRDESENRSRYCAAEPRLWEIDEPHAPTIARAFAMAGLPLTKSSGDVIQGWAQLSLLMNQTVTDPSVDNDPPRPALVVSNDCRQLQRLLPLLREGQGTGINAREDIDNKTEAALAHALRIGAMSRPSPTHIEPLTPPPGTMGHELQRAREQSESETEYYG